MMLFTFYLSGREKLWAVALPWGSGQNDSRGFAVGPKGYRQADRM
jgi:hypothetical protein